MYVHPLALRVNRCVWESYFGVFVEHFSFFSHSKWSKICSMMFKSEFCGARPFINPTSLPVVLFVLSIAPSFVCALDRYRVGKWILDQLIQCQKVQNGESNSAFIVPRTCTRSPTSSADKHPHTSIDTPPCFTIGCKQTSLNSSPVHRRTYWRCFVPKSLNFDSSLQKPFSTDQNSSHVTRKVKVLSLFETINEKSTFRAKALR